MKYQANIDGLRAIAILAVVLFHLDVPTFSGGYIGVDVFFVISGYLISSIIKAKVENQSFSFADFYVRRIRRLLPALLVTIAVTFLAAGFILLPEDMKLFARSAFASLFSLSNIVFYEESGYWDRESALKPLLHTWSLGVEEQFYIFWPAFFIGLLRIRTIISLFRSLGLITVLGATLCIWFTYKYQGSTAAFYLLPFRVFQFSMGAMVIPIINSLKIRSALRHGIIPDAIFSSGLIAIVISILVFDSKTVFPGWSILLPTVGSMLVLISGVFLGECFSFRKILMENPASLWIGKVSYAMYLVHWPIISLYRYDNDNKLSDFDRSVLFSAIVLLTLALHYWVERRFYVRGQAAAIQLTQIPKTAFVLRTFAFICLLAIIVASAWMGDGWAWRFPKLALTTEQIIAGKNDRFSKELKACNVKNWPSVTKCTTTANTQILVFGNSHETDGFNFLNAATENEDVNLISFGSLNNCGPLHKEGKRFISTNLDCQQRLDALFSPRIIQTIDIIFYAANQPYSANKKTILDLLQSMLEQNPSLRLFTLGGYINNKRPCSYYINKTGDLHACALPENVGYFAVTPERETFFHEFKAIESLYIDRVQLLCNRRTLDSCITSTTEGIPMSYDEHHQSLEFAEMSGRLFKRSKPGFLKPILHRN
jgi:peptidoglycan/LPS O-acetylase OafA/YrhL